ncbi:MAG: VCBS repeat-containing protein [Acidobacteria bacterium]|nr:VCBS repeat-containing protein [Acidobacteriota bacterium]
MAAGSNKLRGTTGNDTIRIGRNGESIVIEGLGGGNLTISSFAPTGELVIYGLEGDDTLEIDFSGGPFPFSSVSFHGGGQVSATGDTVTLLGGSFDRGVSDPINSHDGTITYSGGETGNFVLKYTGLEPINDLTVVADFTINATTALNFLNIVNGPIVSATQTTQVNDGGGAFELVNVANKATLRINALDGSDQIAFNNNLKGVGINSFIVSGGIGNDQFNINGPGTVAGTSYVFNGGDNDDLFVISGGLLSAAVTINGDAHNGATPNTQDRLTVNSFASNVTQSATQLGFSGGQSINFATTELISLNNLNTLSVSGTAASDSLLLSKPTATDFRSVLNSGLPVEFNDPAAAVGAQFFANVGASGDTFTVDNTSRLVDLRVAYNADASAGDVLNVFGNPGSAIARESYIVGASEDAGRLVLDPNGNMGYLKTSVTSADGDELDISFNGLDSALNSDTPADIFDIALSASPDNATISNDGVLLNTFQSMRLVDNLATFVNTRLTRKTKITVAGFLSTDTIAWNLGNVSANLANLEFYGFLPPGLGVDDAPGSSINRDVVDINDPAGAVRNGTFTYSTTQSVVDISGLGVSTRVGTAETITYDGSATNNDRMTIVDNASAALPAQVSNLTSNGAEFTRNGGVGNPEFAPDIIITGLGGVATPLTVDGSAPTTNPGDLFVYGGPSNATVTLTGAGSGTVTAAGVIGVAYQNFEATRFSNRKPPADFDGDLRTDVSIFRPASGQWWLNRSTLGTITHTFGNSADRLEPGDYTGDGKTDVAIYRPSTSEWFVLRSEDSTFFSFPFGTAEDLSVPADYDGDGRADAAVFRPSSSTWFIQRSSGGTTIQPFGSAGDKPAPADYDGDGKADIAVFRPSNGQWWLNRSTAGIIVLTFGISTDRQTPGDFTGDGKADVAFWRPGTGEWFVLRSEDLTFFSFPFGTVGDIPAPGDYDGDGKFDAAVFRPSTATWFLRQSTAGTSILGFGISTDLPVPTAYLP